MLTLAVSSFFYDISSSDTFYWAAALLQCQFSRGWWSVDNEATHNQSLQAYFELKHISSIHRYLTKDAAKQPVTSCLLSGLDYFNSLLVGTPDSVIQSMQKVQNGASCLILSTPRHKNCTPLPQQFHWLPVFEWIKCKTACMCYNTITGSDPSYLSELLHLYSPSRSLCSSWDTRMLKLQCFNHKTHGFHTFSYLGPHIWNNLLQNIRHSATLSSFMSKLETFLFAEYFS